MALSTVVFADPFFSEMDRAMNRFINSALGNPMSSATAGGSSRAGVAQPTLAMDIIETPTAYELHADTPGMTPEDVKVELHEGVLTVSGERKISHSLKDEGGKVWRSERSSYSFSRAFTLPENANAEDISASINKGVLRVTVPKKEPPAKKEPKRIAVKSAL
ncbi:hypothetical protein VOLCADRAFT_76187 [Volvox carteri f. nagariensis]|uniref:SHSP domain-containing protein n=1 Tax=Volvox carteri f. nagariensis TaxID=3068 RepID=D8U6F2_VOLCA|nr:uncharacterized protein VOLCADRAFT_76187 [Volvox carteri f. nagariensis]EFJ44635.1 hypothetical protein VOLCADRAFT_76187 [Volvox carteri f. nagariensis]|eukprot:XP_002954211.1 hypothetical protein VOLCADRAFT_76187 [Volvox carteri f. nagariensis]